jgi:hypothetical protein
VKSATVWGSLEGGGWRLAESQGLSFLPNTPRARSGVSGFSLHSTQPRRFYLNQSPQVGRLP